MPKITSSADLRNNYNEISNFCRIRSRFLLPKTAREIWLS